MERFKNSSAVLNFPLRESPFIEHLRLDDREWFSRLLRNQNPAVIQRYLSFHSHRYTAYCYPDAAYERTLLVNHWIGWGFALDDTLGSGVFRADPERVHNEFVTPLVTLHTNPQKVDSVPQYPLIQAFVDFWKQMYPSMGPTWRQRFIQHETEWLNAYCWEAQMQAQGVMLAEECYRAMRLKSVSSYILYDLVEFALQLELPTEIYESVGCQQFLSHSLEALTWDNDLTSVAKEKADGEQLNIVLIRLHQRGYSLQEAIDSVCELIASEVRQCLEGAKQLLAQFPAQTSLLQRYISGVQSLMVGTGTWQRESRRYDPRVRSETAERVQLH